MGRIYVRTFGDCEKNGLILEITCQRCGRVAYRHATDFIGFKMKSGRQIRRHHNLEDVAAALRCRGGAGVIGCGGKGATIAARWREELKAPAGVPLLPFLNADDRERKRLIRIARG